MESPTKLGKYIPMSELNMDNAWVEYTVMDYHEASGSVLAHIELKVIISKFCNQFTLFLLTIRRKTIQIKLKRDSKYEQAKWMPISDVLESMYSDMASEKYLRQVANDHQS